MIEALHLLDRKAALGVLARAAISLDSSQNPAAQAVLPDEMSLREKVLATARARVGVSPDDDSPAALERIGDILDQEADGLAGPSDMDAALRRLAESGSLPSDMYEISVNSGLADWFGRGFAFEKELIEATIRLPDKEQHYGPLAAVNEPSLASLFYRRFTTRWPFKDFHMLVVGARNGLALNVCEAWRIYPSLLDVRDATNLVDILRLFANQYGARVEWEGKTASFFLTVDQPLPREFTYNISAKPNAVVRVGIAQITQHKGLKPTSALVVAVDLMRYKSLLAQMHVDREDIMVGLRRRYGTSAA